MRHAALRFAYDGTCFPAYARDPGQPGSVEAVLADALAPEGLVELRTGSRTDASVSARMNVCRVALERPHLEGLLPAVASRLPAGLWMTGLAPVDATWEPRHARERTYRYYAWPPQDGGGARGAPGDGLERAREAARRFLGTHDMRAFARLEEGRDSVRMITGFQVEREGPLWRFEIAGPSFLWNQVRRMVGAVLAVAAGKAEAADIDAALASGRPHHAFATVPAGGLVLWDVQYDGLEWQEAGPGRALRDALVEAHVRQALVSSISGTG